MSLSPKDMDFIEARHVAAREIALALGVPPMLLGIPGDNTYSNLAEAQRIFWRQTVLPLVTRTATALTNWLAATYEPDARGARKDAPDLRLVPDLDAIEALSAERETLWARLEKTSFLTPDEKRAAIGYGPRPPADGNKFRSPTLTDKFSPTQPRIPAGRPGGGQWTDGDDGGGGVINDVTDVIATVLDQIDIEDIDLGPIDGDIGDEPDNLLHLIADRGSLLSPSAIRSLYRDYTGHHVVPLAETILRGNVLTPDAIDELSRRTVGGDGLKDQRDPDNPHRGRTTEHRDYSQAVRETTDRFTKDNGITKDNPMTREQAGRLADEVANSKDARIKRFLRSIEDCVGRSNTGNARIRVPRGGGRGQD